MDEKKRKRASSIDILIQSSLYLSMTSRESLSSSDEAENKGGGEEDEEGEEGEEDGNNAETEEEDGDEVGDEYNESCLYSSSSTCQNHAPFAVNSFQTARSHSPLSEETHTMTSTESRSMNISDSDADSSVFDDSMNAMATAAAAHSALTTTSFSPPITQHKKEFSNSQRQLSSEWESSWKLETQEELPRTRRTNRPRASTFSVSHTSSSQSLFDTEAERTPLGMITWLASLEEDDFVAAKLLAELSSKEKDEVQDPNKCDIPKYRGSRSKEKERDMTAALQEASKRRIAGMEPPTQRRRRANSVIEVSMGVCVCVCVCVCMSE